MRFVKPLILVLVFLFISSVLAENYKQKSAEAKSKYLWSKINGSKHSLSANKKLPGFSSFGAKELVRLGWQGMANKVSLYSDFAPKGWVKYIHKRGVVGQVVIEPNLQSDFTGAIAKADHALLRLSITYKPKNKKGRGFAPGLALKILRDNTHSVNVSALYKLDGQEQNYNFFTHALSNIVPSGGFKFALNAVHQVFKAVTNYPEEILIDETIKYDQKGLAVNKVKEVRQVFFVPNPSLSFSSDKHDFRHDLLSIPAGKKMKLYDIYAVPGKKDYNYLYKYKNKHIKRFLQTAMSDPKNRIATIYLKENTKFVASQFGDEGILFRHEIRKKTASVND